MRQVAVLRDIMKVLVLAGPGMLRNPRSSRPAKTDKARILLDDLQTSPLDPQSSNMPITHHPFLLRLRRHPTSRLRNRKRSSTPCRMLCTPLTESRCCRQFQRSRGRCLRSHTAGKCCLSTRLSEFSRSRSTCTSSIFEASRHSPLSFLKKPAGPLWTSKRQEPPTGSERD